MVHQFISYLLIYFLCSDGMKYFEHQDILLNAKYYDTELRVQ